MNAYIIVEGNRTEYKVYPAWLKLMVPNLRRVQRPIDLTGNSYYLFSGGGIPSIYNHVANAAEDIAYINSMGNIRIDYLIVCIDTEEESRDYILEQINKVISERNVDVSSFKLEVFEQKVSMESWFLANRRIYKSNPEDEVLRRYMLHYNVREKDPELMDKIDGGEFSTKAQFHNAYLKRIFKEQHISYSKTNPGEVCKEYYLNQIIKRYSETGHVSCFGCWYSFVVNRFS